MTLDGHDGVTPVVCDRFGTTRAVLLDEEDALPKPGRRSEDSLRLVVEKQNDFLVSLQLRETGDMPVSRLSWNRRKAFRR